jgi:hypothetical protein
MPDRGSASYGAFVQYGNNEENNMDLQQPPNAVIAALRTYRIRTTFDRRFASALFVRMAYGEDGQRRLNALLRAVIEQQAADRAYWDATANNCSREG